MSNNKEKEHALLEGVRNVNVLDGISAQRTNSAIEQFGLGKTAGVASVSAAPPKRPPPPKPMNNK